MTFPRGLLGSPLVAGLGVIALAASLGALAASGALPTSTTAPVGQVPAEQVANAATTPAPEPTAVPASSGGHAWDGAGSEPRTLRPGTPEQAVLASGPLKEVTANLHRLTGGATPAAPGGVALVARRGVVAVHEAAGLAVRYADDNRTELPADAQRPMTPETIVDIASLSKLFTAIVVLQLVEDGELGLDEPVADHLPRFAAGGKGSVTVRQLLTHTGGLPAGLQLWEDHDTIAERRDAALAVDLVATPGTTRIYSDLGFITLGELAETVTGRGLDELVAARITEPLGMADTGYRPDPALKPRIAATEHQPWAGRGLVHGDVSDPNAWALGGVAGHAGVFSTAEDLAVLAQTLLNGGQYDHARILDPQTMGQLMGTQPDAATAGSPPLGFMRNEGYFMGELASPAVVGHTGYTGTSLAIHPHTNTIVVVLTNRVHPGPDGPAINPYRRAVANAVAAALP